MTQGGKGKVQGGLNPVNASKQTPKQESRPTGSTMIRVSINGQTGEIPLDKYMEFKKKYPQAKRIN